jgi:hypothetical protein
VLGIWVSFSVCILGLLWCLFGLPRTQNQQTKPKGVPATAFKNRNISSGTGTTSRRCETCSLIDSRKMGCE